MTERNPGVYAGIPNTDYHRGPGISKSGLDLIARSPLHYRYATDAANENDRQPTPDQRIGSLAHALILEPETFADHYALPFEAPEGALAGSDEIKERLRDLGLKVSGAKSELIERLRDADPSAVFRDDLFAEYLAENEGKTIISREEHDAAIAMRSAVMSHPLARLLLTGDGKAELSAYWNDPETGVLCRCRPDYWRADGVLVDLKTTADASPEAFARSVLDWRYHVQAAMYLEGTTAAIFQGEIDDAPKVPFPADADGSDPDEFAVNHPHAFVFVVVEKKPPHAVACYMLDAETIAIGQRDLRKALATYAECERSGQWPGLGDGLQALSLPEWYIARRAREVQA